MDAVVAKLCPSNGNAPVHRSSYNMDSATYLESLRQGTEPFLVRAKREIERAVIDRTKDKMRASCPATTKPNETAVRSDSWQNNPIASGLRVSASRDHASGTEHVEEAMDNVKEMDFSGACFATTNDESVRPSLCKLHLEAGGIEIVYGTSGSETSKKVDLKEMWFVQVETARRNVVWISAREEDVYITLQDEKHARHLAHWLNRVLVKKHRSNNDEVWSLLEAGE